MMDNVVVEGANGLVCVVSDLWQQNSTYGSMVQYLLFSVTKTILALTTPCISLSLKTTKKSLKDVRARLGYPLLLPSHLPRTKSGLHQCSGTCFVGTWLLLIIHDRMISRRQEQYLLNTPTHKQLYIVHVPRKCTRPLNGRCSSG
jgi:hypothetical protein